MLHTCCPLLMWCVGWVPRRSEGIGIHLGHNPNKQQRCLDDNLLSSSPSPAHIQSSACPLHAPQADTDRWLEVAAEFEACAAPWLEPTCQHFTDEVRASAAASLRMITEALTIRHYQLPHACTVAAASDKLAASQPHPLKHNPSPPQPKPPLNPTPTQPQPPQAREAAKPSILSHIEALEDHLPTSGGGASLLGGATLTLADVSVACALLPLWQKVLGADVQRGFPAVGAWLVATGKNEHFASVMGAWWSRAVSCCWVLRVGVAVGVSGSAEPQGQQALACSRGSGQNSGVGR